jgi:hypothetical protein
MRTTAARTPPATSPKTRRNLAVVALLALATCNEPFDPSAPGSRTAARKTLGVVPPTETATWQRGISAVAPEGRFLQAVAMDTTRQVVVMFGGEDRPPTGGLPTTTQDLWEWSPTTGGWTMRPMSGAVPDARAGAAMVFDPVHNKMLLSGGRSASGYNYEDLWEWDPTTGAWTERSPAGAHPSARAQHGMVFEKTTGKILLYGGGRSSASTSDGTAVSTSLGDTWELDPATGTWTALAPASSPGVRHDFGLVWDSSRDKAVLFGGMQIDIPGATGVPKQDTWEWDAVAQTWSERTAAGSKPSQRYGHAMAFDGSRNQAVVFGGWDMVTTGSKNDLWDWDPATGAWTQRLTGTEIGVAGARTFASLVFDGVRARLLLFAGQVSYSPDPTTGSYGLVGSNEVWDIDPATVTFTNRSVAYQGPSARAYHAMAYNPTTGKTYVFGGVDPMWKSGGLADLWEWDGSQWAQVAEDKGPTPRLDAALAYDPARKSLILFGGTSWTGMAIPNETWEWNSTTRQWTQLAASGTPNVRWGHAMVADTVRNRILLFGGSNGVGVGPNDLWEWDGATLTWTNRTPVIAATAPLGRNYPVMSFDETRAKLVLYDGSRSPASASQSTSAFWDFDVVTAGWSLRDPNDSLPGTSNAYVVYDSARRRHVFFTDATVNGVVQTWELDTVSATWYVRSLGTTPGSRFRSAMVYDSARRRAVLFGGTLTSAPGGTADDTWEYSVTNLGNGEGCTAATAATCASGHCVDGVCCDVAACSGACKSCNVAGSAGTCVLAAAGTEVPGSCADGQACDGAGTCKSKNGQACAGAGTCASGFCVDGVCCDAACAGTCVACNLTGHVGTCTPQMAGTDPNSECGQGSGTCKSTCDGVGACTFPLGGSACGPCLTCDGAGTCTRPDPACGSGGSGGKPNPGSGGSGGSGGKPNPGSGGSGGAVNGGSSGSGGFGSGGFGSGGRGGSGGSSGSGGVGSGGSGGTRVTGSGGIGSGGAVGGSGGSLDAGITTARGGTGGASGGAGGALDAGGGHPDATVAADAGLVAKLQRGGCSCELGGARSPAIAFLPWALAAAGLVRRRRGQRKT